MAKIISIGSGKGGVGKSVISTNLAFLLGRSGLSVTLIDMDAGGADLHILLGLFNPEFTLTDFIDNKVESLKQVEQEVKGFNHIKIIPGTGDSLFTANMPAATRAKLLRHIRKLDSDIVIIDVGAGTHFNTLDFFLAADLHLCVATSDPTSILDLYRFVKLAIIRKALSSFLSYDDLSQVIRKRNIKCIDELLEIASEFGHSEKEKVLSSIEEINLAVIFNQVSTTPTASFSRLRELLISNLKIDDLHLLGKIPEDERLKASVKKYQPVTSFDPTSTSSLAFETVYLELLKALD